MGNEEKERTLVQKLCEIQSRLNAPKSQYNSFGKYHYRNCEDILEAAKPLLRANNITLTVSDEVIEKAGRVYILSNARIRDGVSEDICVQAFAREPESKKGMDEMQITGAASSYARKYALCGLFAIDDNKDVDSMDNRATPKPSAKPEPKPEPKPDEFIEPSPEHVENYEKTAAPHVAKKLKSKLVQICNQRGASPQMMRDWILTGFGKSFDDMTPGEQADCVAIAEREFSVTNVEAV